MSQTYGSFELVAAIQYKVKIYIVGGYVMFKSKLFLASMSSLLLAGAIGLPASQAFAASPQTAVVSSVKAVSVQGSVEAAGKLGFLVRGALVVIKNAVKYGGEALSHVVKWLDADTAKYLSKNTNKISDGIDKAIGKISELGDYATATIRTILLDGLRAAGVPDKYGVAIAEAIAATVDLLLL
ncbi:hypothetical protein MH117_01555 [Paenibacillus sp. ACRRX]|uniref:hypothetical protein n=1 Tax=unclassified Paenibacillus TaxID=185978 RepID=UPI001EF43576|nr:MULTISPECIES: hypothetical protein [unclassified Paenibacillus]MCG7406086.1 hypothetical protein [Paenibacillus sp. ACRRX]MDK8182540.1 hypothetical protein [Paenibacillus sp. UMB4589-SE434]